MERRAFLKTSTLAISSSLICAQWACNQPQSNSQPKSPMSKRKNWAGNLSYSTDHLHEPSTVQELQQIVKELDKSKALGTCHSFSKIADSKYNQISLMKMGKEMVLDKETRTVWVDGAVRYGELALYLFAEGYALHNLASLPHISIAGACATGTHGSGDKNGNLPSIVQEIEIITGKGERKRLSKEKDGDEFLGAVVGLGALGIVTKLRLAVVPHFEVRQDVYLNMSLDQLAANFEEIFSQGYSVSLFTDWRKENINQVWVKSKIEEGVEIKLPAELFGAQLADRDVHPILEVSAENCTAQMGVPGPWYERLPHFRMDFTPSKGEELQTEFFVPREHAVEAIRAVFSLSDQVSPQLLIAEIRSIAADDFWMSPCYQEDHIALHFTWKQNWEEVKKVISIIEEKLIPLRVRPHWAKLYSLSKAHLESVYPRMNDFREMAKRYDPEGKFRNEYLERKVFG